MARFAKRTTPSRKKKQRRDGGRLASRSSRFESLEVRYMMAGNMPNIILINTDDQRFDTLPYMPVVQTQLVPNSTVFTNSFVPTPICAPSRASLLTGQYAFNHGVLHVLEPWGGFQNFNDSATLATWLDAAGYNTAMVGKYLNGYDANAYANRDPNDTYVPPGWDEWRAMVGASFNSPKISVNGDTQFFPGQYSTDVLSDMAVDFIDANPGDDSTPFFLYYAPHNPHEPALVANRHQGAYDGIAPHRPPSFNEADISDKPNWVKNQLGSPMTPAAIAALDEFREDQLESLLSVDEGIGRMLDALRASGQLSNTVIIFTSDNGQHWGEHRFDEKGPAWEESIRVPLLIYDGRNPNGQTVDEMALNIDLAPTILQVAGLAPPPAADGRSLVPLINNQAVDWRDDFLIERYIGDGGRYYGIRTERYTYTEYVFTNSFELYDNLTDPYQLVSRHNDPAYAAVRQELAARLAQLKSSDNAGPITSNVNATVTGGVVTLTASTSDATTGGDEVRNAEYFVNSIGNTGTGKALRVADGLYDSVSENMVTEIAGLSPGVHTIYVHGRDISGNWGPFVSIQVDTRVQQPSVHYRVNAGGGQVAGSPAWGVDTAGNPSTHSNAASGGSAVFTTASAINMSHVSLPAGTPASIFQTARFDKPGGENLLWDFAVTPGQYEVRLYFAETWNGAFANGVRVFDVSIEGTTVLNDYDIYADVGGLKGVMKSFVVTSDGNLDIDFLRVVQNPTVNAIEIVPVSQQLPSPLNVSAAALNFGDVAVGQTASRQVTLTNGGASGGRSITIDPAQASKTPAGAPFTISFSQSSPIVLTPGQSTTVTVVYAPVAAGASSATLSIPHDGANSPLSIELIGVGTVSQGAAVYRVNAGGPQIAGSPAWTADSAASPAPYSNAGSGGNSATSTTAASINMTHPSIPAGTPMSLFQSERFDKPAGANLLWDFPVAAGQYEVRLYFAETYAGTFATGARLFDVLIEGVNVLNDYDVFADVGSNKGVVKSFVITSDANLDIDFLRVKENPAIKAIEIRTVPGAGVAIASRLLDGDFDGDGSVDGADFLQWQRGLSGDSRGETGAAELDAWKANFGRTAAAAAADHAIEAFTMSAVSGSGLDPRLAGLALGESFQPAASEELESHIGSEPKAKTADAFAEFATPEGELRFSTFAATGDGSESDDESTAEELDELGLALAALL